MSDLRQLNFAELRAYIANLTPIRIESEFNHGQDEAIRIIDSAIAANEPSGNLMTRDRQTV
jgi:hypothetical protein